MLKKITQIILILFSFSCLGQKTDCNCDSTKFDLYPTIDLSIENSDHWKDTLSNWIKSNDPKKVKVLDLGWFGEIPEELQIFTNVESIVINSINGTITNLNLFPKLETLILEESRVSFSEKSAV